MQYIIVDRRDWEVSLKVMLEQFDVYASLLNDFGQDYEQLTHEKIINICYNTPKPASPLKTFFLPIKENVTSEHLNSKIRVIIGIPNCDVEALKILDEIYLDPDFIDPFYKNKRDNTVLITTDCFSIQENCHCTTYGVMPYSQGSGDISIALVNGQVILKVFSSKGEKLLESLNLKDFKIDQDKSVEYQIEKLHSETVELLSKQNGLLPDYRKTGEIIVNTTDEIWKNYSSTCVSCGACSAICPTCSCFLLVDKPNFEKVKQLDTCQYPGFERVAGGEDALHNLFVRFRNRYMCKYVWKPEKFESLACTGCGRCIDGCIGKISKNKLFIELVK